MCETSVADVAAHQIILWPSFDRKTISNVWPSTVRHVPAASSVNPRVALDLQHICRFGQGVGAANQGRPADGVDAIQ